MRRLRRSLLALLFTTTLLASLLMPSVTANATSVYDNTVRVTEVLTVRYAPFARVDVSGFYTSLIREGCTSEYFNSFSAAMNGQGEYSITKAERGSSETRPDDEFVFVTWSENGSGSLAFQTEYGTYRSLYRVTGSGVSYRSAQIYMNSQGLIQVACTGSGQSAYQSTNQPNLATWDFTIWVNTFDVAYPSGYEGHPVPTEPPPAKYVAMGDSFSGGEGVRPFEAGTDTGSNTCHRSLGAYPRLIQSDLNLGSMTFAACSGAVSDYIIDEYNQENVEPPQAVKISNETELVTISIGGNDVGFGDVLTTCTLATEEEGTSEEKHQIEHDACIDAIDNARGVATGMTFQNKLETVFSGLRSLGSPNLQVIVVGYPNLLPAFGDIVGSCTWAGDWFTPTSGRAVADDETQKARLLHDELNEAIEDAVEATNDSNIHFVDPTAAFAGHELCRPSPWFNGVVPAADPVMRRLSYHPNGSGQVAYAGVVAAAIGDL